MVALFNKHSLQCSYKYSDNYTQTLKSQTRAMAAYQYQWLEESAGMMGESVILTPG